MKRRMLWQIGFLLLASGALGCDFAPSSRGETGELGNGGFSYKCTGEGTDIACINVLSLEAMVMAVGVPVVIDYTPRPATSSEDQASAPLTVSLKTASPDLLVADGKGFRFTRAGTAALLARSPSGVVADFVHLQGAEIDHLDAEDSLGVAATSVHLDPLGSVLITVTPRDAMGRKLAGPLHYAWETSDASVVSLTVSSPVFGSTRANQVTLVAGQQDGTATISVTVQEKVLEIPVQVGGAP